MTTATSPAQAPARARRRPTRRQIAPYVLLAPGILWLIAFFVLPNIQMLVMSLSEGSVRQGYEFTWAWSNYTDSIVRFERQFMNSLVFGGLATLICFLVGYPLAYGIAFRGGRLKTLLLFLVIAPFFTSFLLRTISWKIILGERGPFLGFIHSLGIVPDNFSVLGTPLAVVSGLVYEFLPFMVLPLYVALEKIDRRLVEAAKDLYAGPWRPGGAIVGGLAAAALAVVTMAALGYMPLDRASEFATGLLVVAAVGFGVGAFVGWFLISQSFLRVIWPLSLPGVFAGSILCFIPAIGDYVNVELLGNPRTQMIGNVIQNRFLSQNDYPTAAALSFMLMAGILVALFIYARFLGTDQLASAGRV
jgi:spermidine/putrescine transport system permease protein